MPDQGKIIMLQMNKIERINSFIRLFSVARHNSCFTPRRFY